MFSLWDNIKGFSLLIIRFQEREVLVSMGGGAVIFAVLTLLCAKLITIVSSSIVGSAMIVSSIDFFMHGLKTVTWVGVKSDFHVMIRVNVEINCSKKLIRSSFK